MPNNYCRLPHLKADEAGVTTNTLDTVLDRANEQASREFDRETCGRHLFAKAGETRYFHRNSTDHAKLWVGDILSIGAVGVDLDRDGVFELTLVEGTDFFQGPEAREPGWPYEYLYLLPASSQIAYWPPYERSVRLSNSIFGFSYETEAIVSAGAAVTGTLSDASDLTLACSADVSSLIYVGDTMVIEDEQMPVASVSTSTVTLASRGLNGTTAVAHTAKAITIRRFPREVERVVAERVVSGRWQSQGGYDAGAGMTGDGGGRAVFARWKSVARMYRDMRIA